MTGHVDDALVVCLIAASLIVCAHGIDAIGSRYREDGWWHSLALALCGLAIGLLLFRLVFVRSTGDAIELLATATAVAVSALPLLRVRGPGDERRRPANPWDRAYRITPTRVAQLLSPAARPRRPSPQMRGRPATSSSLAPRALTGTVLPPRLPRSPATPGQQPPGPSDDLSNPVHLRAAYGPTQEAAEALHDVDELLNGVSHLLGLERGRRRRN